MSLTLKKDHIPEILGNTITKMKICVRSDENGEW